MREGQGATSYLLHLLLLVLGAGSSAGLLWLFREPTPKNPQILYTAVIVHSRLPFEELHLTAGDLANPTASRTLAAKTSVRGNVQFVTTPGAKAHVSLQFAQPLSTLSDPGSLYKMTFTARRSKQGILTDFLFQEGYAKSRHSLLLREGDVRVIELRRPKASGGEYVYVMIQAKSLAPSTGVFRASPIAPRISSGPR